MIKEPASVRSARFLLIDLFHGFIFALSDIGCLISEDALKLDCSIAY